jgi:elongation factor P
MRIDELRVGSVITVSGDPYIIIDSSFMKTAQRRPVMRTKLRSLKDGRVLEKSYKQGDKVEAADVNRAQAQYLYLDGTQYYFMDQESYEQFSISKEILGDQANYLKEGGIVTVLNFEGKPMTLELPNKIELKVAEAPPGIKGDTATGGTKEVTLENGLKVNVPLFIKEGDIVKINTESGEYSERAGQA